MGRQYIDPPFAPFPIPLAPSRPALLLTRLLGSRPAALIPTQCAVCRGWSGERICDDCRARFMAIAARCTRCAMRVPAGVCLCGACLTDPPAQDGAIAAMDYAHPFDRLVTQFKFNAALDLSPVFASVLAAAWRTADGPRPDLIVPVPLSDERLRARGFNQSGEIARRVARLVDVPMDSSLLLRIRDTPHQLAFPVGKRASNVKGAFAIEPRRRPALAGKTVAVVDDVMTTGATIGEIARVLKQAGAAEVHAWVLARTPSPGQ